MKDYKIPLTFEDIEKQDSSLEDIQRKQYEQELQHFKRTSELFISLFSNSKRINRDFDKTDHIQLIAVRIFQDARSALILSLKGLYPQASVLLRNILESISLIYDFKINPEHEDIWMDGSKKKREELFKSSKIRRRIEEAKVTDYEPIKGLYGLLSTWTVHANQESYIWYIELKNKTRLYHWAGHMGGKRADALMLETVQSLAQGLFVLVEEGIYAFEKPWLRDYYAWKKEHLEFAKKLARVFGNEDILKLEMKIPEF